MARHAVLILTHHTEMVFGAMLCSIEPSWQQEQSSHSIISRQQPGPGGKASRSPRPSSSGAGSRCTDGTGGPRTSSGLEAAAGPARGSAAGCTCRWRPDRGEYHQGGHVPGIEATWEHLAQSKARLMCCLFPSCVFWASLRLHLLGKTSVCTLFIKLGHRMYRFGRAIY